MLVIPFGLNVCAVLLAQIKFTAINNNDREFHRLRMS